MMTASTVGKPILVTRWSCSLFKGTLAISYHGVVCFMEFVLWYSSLI